MGVEVLDHFQDEHIKYEAQTEDILAQQHLVKNQRIRIKLLSKSKDRLHTVDEESHQLSEMKPKQYERIQQSRRESTNLHNHNLQKFNGSNNDKLNFGSGIKSKQNLSTAGLRNLLSQNNLNSRQVQINRLSCSHAALQKVKLVNVNKMNDYVVNSDNDDNIENYDENRVNDEILASHFRDNKDKDSAVNLNLKQPYQPEISSQFSRPGSRKCDKKSLDNQNRRQSSKTSHLRIGFANKSESNNSRLSSSHQYKRIFTNLHDEIYLQDNQELESILAHPYVQKKLQKFMNHLKGLNIDQFTRERTIESPENQHTVQVSYQQYLEHVTGVKLLKYNPLNSLPLRQSLNQTKMIFKEICREIQSFFEMLQTQEQKVLALNRSHQINMIFTDSLHERILKKLSEILNSEKAFKFIERETEAIVNSMAEIGRDKLENPGLKQKERMRVKDLRMAKYMDDWERLENIELRQYPRLVNRIKVGYKSDLNLKKLVANNPIQEPKPLHMQREDKSKKNHGYGPLVDRQRLVFDQKFTLDTEKDPDDLHELFPTSYENQQNLKQVKRFHRTVNPKVALKLEQGKQKDIMVRDFKNFKIQ